MSEFWTNYKDLSNYANLNVFRQQELYEWVFSLHGRTCYRFDGACRMLMEQISDKEQIDKLFNHYLACSNTNGYSDYAYDIVLKVYNASDDKEELKNRIISSKKKFIIRTLLLFDDLSAEHEEQALRAISTTKYIMDDIFKNRYKPSVEAIKKLPPVMRLSVLESLSRNHHIGYNIFENFGHDEFKSLLFGSVLRHRDRAEKVYDRYKELSYTGTEATVTVKTSCDICGEYSVDLSSVRVRTESGLRTTRIGRFMLSNNCMLCGKFNNHMPKEIVYPEDNDD